MLSTATHNTQTPRSFVVPAGRCRQRASQHAVGARCACRTAAGTAAAPATWKATLAEHEHHHPDILIRYSRVTLSLSTHDAGGITDKDFDFAHAADRLAVESGAK